MPIVIASSRGQIVIPREIRRQLNIKPGKKLLVKIVGNKAIIEPLPDDPVEAFCGVFREGDSLTESLMEDRRKERDRENSKTA